MQLNKVIISDIQEIGSIIEDCYSKCKRTQELHNDFSGYSVKECVNDIIEKLNDLEHYTFYKVDNIGYFGTTNISDVDFLYTFFVKPEFRNKKDLTLFWNLIKNTFTGNFMAGVYKSNEPAKRFLKRNNGIQFENNNESYFTFMGE